MPASPGGQAGKQTRQALVSGKRGEDGWDRVNSAFPSSHHLPTNSGTDSDCAPAGTWAPGGQGLVQDSVRHGTHPSVGSPGKAERC